MSNSEIYLLAMLLIFSVPYLIWRLLRTDYFAPLVIVQIITGILMGPSILGALFPLITSSSSTRQSCSPSTAWACGA